MAQVPGDVQDVQAVAATELNATREEELNERVVAVPRCVSDSTPRISVPLLGPRRAPSRPIGA